ncbi:MAG: fibronectin type III domain-containing protein [candidate division WOR-3 bacterium]
MSKIILFLFLYIPPLPPSNIQANDYPNDAGGKIEIKWELSPSDSIIDNYIIFRQEEIEGKWSLPETLEILPRGTNYFLDSNCKNKVKYRYFIRAIKGEVWSDSEFSNVAVAHAEWFHKKRTSVLILLIIILAFLLYFVRRAKKEELFIRKITGLDAIDEAVGRSTELGRPLLFILGLGTIAEIPTIAGLSILKRVAKKAGEYEVDIIVPCYDPVVFVAAQETVKEGFIEAGRPDLYKEGNVFFLSYDQFGYAAGCDGIMVRERPGAIFLQGYFYAESLILAETGNSIGAIQISGTTAVTQLPFFIAATDYTLIGEEMYAASAYLTRDPLSLATIKGEDYVKVLLIIIVIAGLILETIAFLTKNPFFHFLKNFFEVI